MSGYRETQLVSIEIPPRISHLPLLLDDASLAFYLHTRPKSLWYFLLDKRKQYKCFSIHKANGKNRIIHSPGPAIKRVLTHALLKILNPLQEHLGDHVTAYRPRRGIPQAVQQHIPTCPICDAAPLDKTPAQHDCPKYGTMIHMDLRDFFHSTTRAMIRRYFTSLGLSHLVSDLLGSLMTVNDIPCRSPSHHTRSGAPQGSPTSGAICNLVADALIDQPILKLLKTWNKTDKLKDPEWQWRYTRYADDLTFTCGKLLNQTETKERINEITALVNKTPYRVNKRKTRSPHPYYPKRILGATCNSHVNIDRQTYLRTRAIIHNCLVYGFESQVKRAEKDSVEALMDYLKGMTSYIGQLNSAKGAQLKDELNAAVQRHNM